MLSDIEAALRGSGEDCPVPFLLGEPRYCGPLPVSGLATAAVSAAVSSIQSLRAFQTGRVPKAQVDQHLVDRWCVKSVEPVGWSLPSEWDDFARDYQTRDGWIRLHTNAPHHRARALEVLGEPTTPEGAAEAIGRWNGAELEAAIVEAGGCAAELRTEADWRKHPQGIAVRSEPIVAWDGAAKQPVGWVPVSEARPLTGLRVLDLTRVLAGPVGTRFLASFGADVLRVDPPHWEEDGNAIEMSVGKTCAGLDLRLGPDRDTFERLIGSAHVLVHGYRGDALGRLGFGVEALRAMNPSLITVGLCAYGWTGPWKHRRGFDSLVQRSSGLARLDGSGVTALPYQVLDHATGYLMAAAAIHAVRAHASGGEVLSARLSLARQAALLADHSGEAGTGEVADRGLLGALEQTDWGPVRRLPLPYQIKGLEPGWTRPAHRLRSDPAEWIS